MNIPHLLEDHRQAVQNLCPQAKDLSANEARQILARFGAAMEGNFIAWVGNAAVFAQAPEGSAAAKANLIDENSGNHADLLHKFLKSLDALPAQPSHELEVAISEIRQLIAPCSGLEELALMTFLESASAPIMPLVRALAERIAALESLDFDPTYCDVHDAADDGHSSLFAAGLEKELTFHENTKARIQKTEAVVRGFWTAILQSNNQYALEKGGLPR